MGLKDQLKRLEQRTGAGAPVCPRAGIRVIHGREESPPDGRPPCICGGTHEIRVVVVKPVRVEDDLAQQA